MKKKLAETTKEALSSVLPISAVVLILSLTIVPMPVGTLMLFICGALMLIVGMGLFTMGADMSLMSFGEDLGIKMTATKNILLVALISFAMGIIITIAEPDLQVLAELVHGVPNFTMIITVALGVGIFLMIAIFRIIFRISLSKMLIVGYFMVILLSFFTPNNFVPVAFDSGGVTTGPITVPFIMAMGLGLSHIRGDKDSSEDSFGLVSLCSIGPIMAVLILGICYRPESANYTMGAVPDIYTSQEIVIEVFHEIPHVATEVTQAIWPLLAVLAVFQLITRRYQKRQLARIIIGFIYTFMGLVIFLTGVNIGFIPVGQYIGSDLAQSSIRMVLIPLGAVIGYFIVAAEPAVHVLKKQVEEVSGGAIPGSAVQRYLSIGTAVALAISMLRVLMGISLYWFIIPGYSIAIALTFFVPKIFTGIAYDSGGVVSGPMTSTFLLPFAIGACANPDRIMTDAFGLVAMVAMTPLIAIQLMGLIYKKKMLQAKDIDVPEGFHDDIIEFEEEMPNES